jgi:hypothetical protein
MNYGIKSLAGFEADLSKNPNPFFKSKSKSKSGVGFGFGFENPDFSVLWS